MAAKYSEKPIKGNGKNVGMKFQDMYNGATRFSIDGGVSVPLQGGKLIENNKRKLGAAINSTPGVMKVQFLPILGSVEGQSTLASLSDLGEATWRAMRSATPHAENYQPGDIVALLSVAAGLKYGLAKFKRMIESYNYQPSLNSYITDGIWRSTTSALWTEEITAWSRKTNEYVNDYKAVITKLASVKIPDIFPVFHRWEYMSGTIFRDHKDEEKAQFIMFDPTHIYDFQLRDPSDPGLDLVPEFLPNDPHALGVLLYNIAKHVSSDSSMSEMFADLLLTYPEAQCLKWEGSDWTKKDFENQFKTVYDVDVLYALHNAQIAQCNPPTWHVVPKTGTIKGIVSVANGKSALGFYPPILNAVIEENIDSKRLQLLSQWTLFDDAARYSENSEVIELVNTPTEILVDLEIGAWNWTERGERKWNTYTLTKNANTYAGTSVYSAATNPPVSYAVISAVNALASFAWAPIMRWNYVQSITGSLSDTTIDTNLVKQTIVGNTAELERPFLANADQLIQARNAARMGLWNLPLEVFNGKRNGSK